MVRLVAETDKNLFAQSLSRFSGVTVALELSLPLWGPLFYLKGIYVQGLSLVPEMLTSMRLVTGTLGDLSRGTDKYRI